MMIMITILHDNQNNKQNGKKKERQDSLIIAFLNIEFKSLVSAPSCSKNAANDS